MTARVLLAGFVLGLTALSWVCGLDTASLLRDLLVRLPMNGVLVLAMLPMYNAGLGMHFGLPVAIVTGLLGMCLAVNLRLTGLAGVAAAVAMSLPWAVLVGAGYALVLRRVRGREEIASTFVGFAVVSLMNLFWVLAPFSNPAMLWPIGGQGLRPTIGLGPYFGKALNRFCSVQIGGMDLPLGMLLVFAALCLGLHLLQRTALGLALASAGENEAFARVCGVNVGRVRLIAVVLSTCLGAAGIVVYAQSYGFLELYDAPLMMAFPAVSAVLIGGMDRARVGVPQAVLGTVLLQGLLVFSAALANALLVPESAEMVRMLITNGVILAALLTARSRA